MQPMSNFKHEQVTDAHGKKTYFYAFLVSKLYKCSIE